MCVNRFFMNCSLKKNWIIFIFSASDNLIVSLEKNVSHFDFLIWSSVTDWNIDRINSFEIVISSFADLISSNLRISRISIFVCILISDLNVSYHFQNHSIYENEREMEFLFIVRIVIFCKKIWTKKKYKKFTWEIQNLRARDVNHFEISLSICKIWGKSCDILIITKKSMKWNILRNSQSMIKK